MQLTLGMMIHNDNAWLRLHLPVIAPAFDGVLIVTDDDEATSKEAAEIVNATGVGWRMFQHEFYSNWSEMFNHVIDHATESGFTHIIRLDPDELMHPDHIQEVRGMFDECDLITFSRYNFWMDRLHYVAQFPFYPDYQTRAWKLGSGVRLTGDRHEHVMWPNDKRRHIRTEATPIFHYGDIHLPNILLRDFKYLNYARIDAGHQPLAERPEDRPIPHRDNIPFEGLQPIDPAICGIYAPFEVSDAQ